MRKNAAERLAEELARECGLLSDDGHDARYVLDRTRLMRVARHVLRREKRARGRTVGYTAVTSEKLPRLCCNDLHSAASVQMYVEPGGFRLARVVLVEKPRRGK